MKDYITVAEAAKELGVSTGRIRQLYGAGRLRGWKPDSGVKMLLISKKSVASFERLLPGRKTGKKKEK